MAVVKGSVIGYLSGKLGQRSARTTKGRTPREKPNGNLLRPLPLNAATFPGCRVFRVLEESIEATFKRRKQNI